MITIVRIPVTDIKYSRNISIPKNYPISSKKYIIISLRPRYLAREPR
jgi:hypothetical protein